MINQVQVRVVYDRKNQATTKKAGLVQLEITFESKRKFMSTGIKVYKNQWRAGRICGRGDAQALNDQINDQIKDINQLVQEYNSRGVHFTFEALELLHKGFSGLDFLTFFESRISERYIKASTKKQHIKVLNFLKSEYKAIKCFDDLTPAAIRRLDEYMHRRNIRTAAQPQQMAQTTISSYHKIIKHYINEAILSGFMESNPYRRVKIERGQSKPRVVLSLAEIDKIYNFRTTSLLDAKIRDLFIVQVYTGLAFADLMGTDFTKKEKRGEIWVLYDQRQKTGTGYYITLLPRVLEVLDRYGGKLPRLAYDVYNRNLKAVARAAGIEKTVTTHIGRHTFATTIALGSGLPIEVVARMLGHTDIKTTQIYAKIMPEQVLEGFTMIAAKVK